jgi:Secretion system C-terminal sorting domain
MKRAIIFVLLLSMEHYSFSQNLVVNPGFENWGKVTKPTGWNTAVNCQKDSLNIISGNYSCRHSSDISETKNLGQLISVDPGTQYKLSFFYKTEIINNEHGCRIWCAWMDALGTDITDESAKLILQPSSYMKSDNWQEFSIEISSPPNASFFHLEVRTYQSSIAYFDDFVFQKNVTTGLPEEKSPELKIYPNPVHNLLNISNINNMQHIDIQNLSGITLRSFNFPGEKSASIPLSGLTNGLYILRIKTSGKIITRKFIIR